MRPQDLGFAEPCQRCIEFVVGLKTEGHGNLQSLPVDDICSHEGIYYRYVCGSCTSRWLIYDWTLFGSMTLEQESADGKYFATVRHAQGQKHGLHEYYPRHYPANEPRPTTLAELWDRGRLIRRLENGLIVFDAEGQSDAGGKGTA